MQLECTTMDGLFKLMKKEKYSLLGNRKLFSGFC